MTALEGVIPALLTPLDDAGQVDYAALGQLTERLIGRGVTGISPLGSTGEGYSLDLDQRLAVLDTVVARVPASTPVIAGLFAHNPRQASTEIAAYAGHGATAVLITPPAYYPLSAAELEGYFTRVADAAALPLVLYHIPNFTGVPVIAAAAARLAAHPRIIGLKDSGRDLGYATELLDAVAAQGDTGFSVLTGTDSLLVPYLQAGARGTICSNANVVPDLVLAVYQAATSGKLDEALGLEARLRAVQAVFRTGSFPAAYKAVIAATGIGGPGLAPPRQPLDDEQTAGLIKRLTALDVL